jgi:DNA replication initiation complex subunit (GINS family)
MEMTFESLRKVQLLEKTNASLTNLEDDFYSSSIRSLSDKFSTLKQNFSLDEARACENMLKILKDVIERREQKIVLKALRDAKESRNDKDYEATQGLTREEKELYSNILSMIKQHSSRVSAVNTGGAGAGNAAGSASAGVGAGAAVEAPAAAASAGTSATAGEAAVEAKNTQANEPAARAGETEAEAEAGARDAATVRMLIDLPSFLGHDMKPIGPLKAMQVVKLHASDAAILLKRGVAEEIKAG